MIASIRLSVLLWQDCRRKVSPQVRLIGVFFTCLPAALEPFPCSPWTLTVSFCVQKRFSATIGPFYMPSQRRWDQRAMIVNHRSKLFLLIHLIIQNTLFSESQLFYSIWWLWLIIVKPASAMALRSQIYQSALDGENYAVKKLMRK